ncbi:MAG: hypothetical protein QI223_05455, partial [Candidatus Korarchaeota archaeon]|nr:hypothetical protein [Candidatus Korarchaeota archaeon]
VIPLLSGGRAREAGVVDDGLRRRGRRGPLTARWVEGAAGGDKRVYEITEEGVETLRGGLEVLSARRRLFEERFEFYEKTWGGGSGEGN